MKRRKYFLPEDLFIQILSLLPVKSLLRFKCVCKSWYDLLEIPTFISKHLHNNSINNINEDHRRRLIVGHRVFPKGDDITIFSYNNDTLNVISQDFFKFGDDPDDKIRWSRPRLLGSYDGLVCLANESLKEIAFWNPETRQSKIVCQSSNTKSLIIGQLAFGYDFKTNDYKVMRIFHSSGSPYSSSPSSYNIEVYSFNADSWRNSDAVIPDGVRFRDCFSGDYYERPTTCVNGYFSTIAYTLTKEGGELEVYHNFVFTIDMSREVFMITRIPAEAEDVCYEHNCSWEYRVLTQLGESLALLTANFGPGRKKEEMFAVFILNEYGANGTWTKLYTIAPHSEFHCWSRYCPVPIGIWNDDELLLNYFCDGGLRTYNLKTRQHKDLGIGGTYKQILEYNESLVWMNDGDYHHRLGKKRMLNFIRT